jgi:hypothetical protein
MMGKHLISTLAALISLAIVISSGSASSTGISFVTESQVSERSGRNVSGCVAILHSSVVAPKSQRIELSTAWIDSKLTHEMSGSARFQLEGESYNVAAEFTYAVLGGIDPSNRLFEKGESEIVFAVNGFSGRTPVHVHRNLDEYRDGVFYPNNTSRKLEFLPWNGTTTIEFLKSSGAEFYLNLLCTPRYREGLSNRSDTIYLR